MKRFREKYFDGATWLEILIGGALIAGPFLAIIASM